MTALSQGYRRRETFLPLFVIAFVAMALKAPDALTLPQFWAEDASVFFQDQYARVAPQLFLPYAGYLITIPRLVAWIASVFDPVHAPLAYNAFAVGLGAMSIAYVTGKLKDIVPAPLLLATFLLVPTNGEILGNLSNVQWFLQFALAVACLSEKRESHGAMLRLQLVSVVLLATTGPFSVLLMIVVLAMAGASWIARRRNSGLFDGHLATWGQSRDRRFLMAAGVGAAIQVATLVGTMSHRAPAQYAQFAFRDQLQMCFLEIIPIHIFGTYFLLGWPWLLVYAGIFGALVFGRHMRGDRRLAILAILAYAAVESFSPMGIKDVVMMYQFRLSDRYFYVTKVVFWWGAFAAIVAYGRWKLREAAGSVIVVLALVAILEPTRLQRPRLLDMRWKQQAEELRQPGHHVLPVNPIGWVVDVTTPGASGP